MTKNCLPCSISQEPYIIWLSFEVQMYRMIISWGVYLNVKILIFQVVKGYKGQKMAQNDKNFCSLQHLIFQELYIIWSSFMVHMYVSKDNISRHFFIFFFLQNFDFQDNGMEVQKWPKMTKNSVCHSIFQEPYIIWLRFLVHMYKMMISPENLLIFQNFDFWGVLGGKKGKKWPNSLFYWKKMQYSKY